MRAIQIINDTNLSYQRIGTMIDCINFHSQGDTNYYGKVSWCVIKMDNINYKITIHTLKKYAKFIIEDASNE